MQDRRTTIQDIAKASEVSVATVSRALRNLPHVAPATRSRVLEVAARFNYELHPQASRLASGKTWTVGVVAPGFGAWFPSRALSGINSVFAEAGYDLLISTMTNPENRERFLQGARSFCRRVDGIVLIDTFVSDESSSASTFFNRPVVAVGERLEGASSITIDNRFAARRAVEHLIELGHERIGVITGPQPAGLPTVRDQRRLGYEDALRDAGLRIDPSLAIEGGGSAAGGARALSGLIADPDRPTAVFCMWDEMAFGALHAARTAGLAVPGDLSIVGFDDHDLADALELTTMRQSVAEMGVRAAQTVLALIDGTEPVSDITWDVPLVIRNSTAPLR